jgi:hypothetical protein
MVHTVPGYMARFTIFASQLYPNERNKPGYGQLYFFHSAEATTKRLENHANRECMAKVIQ